MSRTELNRNIGITDIIIPDISHAEFAKGLDEAFVNINDNFTKLANREFVKGETGDSVYLDQLSIYDETGVISNELCKSLSLYLSTLLGNQPRYINTENERLDYYENFTPETAGSLQIIYNKARKGVEVVHTPVSSLQYVFLDGRFWNNRIGNVDAKYLDGVTDLSTIIVYDATVEGGFKSLSNALPTMYYENGVGLCWKLNGKSTGMPVQGIPGKNGTSATLYVVRSNEINVSNQLGVASKGVVSAIYETQFGYRDIEDWGLTNDIQSLDQQSAIVIAPNTSEEHDENLFYFGKLGLEEVETPIVDEDGIPVLDEDGNPAVSIDNVLYIYCSPDTAINTTINNESVINAMKSINVVKSDGLTSLKGLFIPLEETDSENKQKVHLLTSTSITNYEGSTSDLKADVLFTPVDDINTVNIDTDHSLQVDKYLYLRVNKKRTFLADAYEGGSDSQNESAYNATNLANYDYYLKYKLVGIVTNTDNTYLNDSVNFGSVWFTDKDESTYVNLSKNNVIYLSGDVENITNATNDKFSSDIFNSMPLSFRESLNSNESDDHVHGIYRWELCNDKAKFDIDNLKQDSEENPTYSFDTNFRYVYTTTLTPSSATEFLWFNGRELVEKYEGEKVNDKYAVYGWNCNIPVSMFEFVKFVPVYNNDFSVDTDTALNLNYNVNITGDEKNPNKSITVHGDVNCDNLSVYSLTATKEIKNISTQDDIHGRRGIYLWENDNADAENEYDFSVNPGGEVIANNITVKDADISNSLHVNAAVLNSADIKELNIKSRGGNTDGYIRTTTIDSQYLDRLEIDSNNIQSIKIKSSDVSVDELVGNTAAPLYKTDLPAHYNGSSNIVVSNQDDDSQMIYYKNVSGTVKVIKGDKEITSSPGSGVSSEKDYISTSTSFDSAKNFNMHRLAVTGAVGGSAGGSTIVKTSGSSQGTASSTTPSLFLFDLYDTVSRRNAFANGNIYLPDNYRKQYAGEASKYTIYDSDDYIKQNCMLDINMTKPTGILKINRSNRIKIKFNNDFFFHIGIQTGQSNGLWGMLHNSSRMWFEVYYIKGDDIRKLDLYSGGSERSFDYSTSSTSDNNGYEWVGHDEIGSKSFAGDGGGYKWRYYTLTFKPSTIEIANNNDNFTKLCNDYDNGNAGHLYIVPRFHLKCHSQNYWLSNADRVAGIRVTMPKPLSKPLVSSYQSNAIKTITDTSRSENRMSIYSTIDTSLKTSCNTVEYYAISDSSAGSNIKSSTICNDGVVITSGNYVFGLGYANDAINYNKQGYKEAQPNTNPHWMQVSNDIYHNDGIPVLFYHKYDSKYYEANASPNLDYVGEGLAQADLLDNKGYALRTNYIPLEDIFNAIKLINNDSTYTYGV